MSMSINFSQNFKKYVVSNLNSTVINEVKKIRTTNKEMTVLANISCYLNLFVLSFGIIGNLLCIYVFLQKNMIARKFNWYLLILAIAELIYCLFVFFDYLFRLIHPANITLLYHFTLLKLNIISNLDAFPKY